MELSLFNLLLFLFGMFLCIQLYYLLFIQAKLQNCPRQELAPEGDFPPLSVILCARNEENHLKMYLSEVLEQDYPQFEVIVVNDASTDDTAWVLKEFKGRYSQLKVVDVTDFGNKRQGKKFAVTMGIKAAQYEHLVFTDADCFPQSNQWLKYMAQQFGPGIEIVLGYSPYTREEGFLNRFIRFETFQTALNYFSCALKGNAYMGVGRNLAYTKTLFFKNKGFASHLHIPSGDDDLFVNQHATKENVAVCLHPDAKVWSIPKQSFHAYRLQKHRHVGAGKAYKGKHQFLLSLQILSAVCFYALFFVLLLLYPGYWYLAVGAFILRLLVQAFVYIPSMKRLEVRDLIGWWPLLDFLYIIYVSFMGVYGLLKQQIKWK